MRNYTVVAKRYEQVRNFQAEFQHVFDSSEVELCLSSPHRRSRSLCALRPANPRMRHVMPPDQCMALCTVPKSNCRQCATSRQRSFGMISHLLRCKEIPTHLDTFRSLRPRFRSGLHCVHQEVNQSSECSSASTSDRLRPSLWRVH